MSIKKHRHLHPQKDDTGDDGNSRSPVRNTSALTLIRNAGYVRPEPQAADKGRGSLRAHSQGKVNDGDDHSPAPAMVRRPYLKPAFQCDIVFSRRLMPPDTKPVIA